MGKTEIIGDDYRAHGMLGQVDEPDWPPLTLAEVDVVVRGYPQAGRAVELLSRSPRPFSAASVVGTSLGLVFVKRHHRSVRDRVGLVEEHRLMAYLAAASWDGEALVRAPLTGADGETVTVRGEWVYEVHPVARGVDVYDDALSWTPFLSGDHARAAGRALARLHNVADGYRAQARQTQQLVTSYTIFAGDSAGAIARMETYLRPRPELLEYVEARNWRRDFEELLLPFYRELEPWLGSLKPLWTHNDFHASNLMWTGDSPHDEVAAIVDFGLTDLTNAVHDLATAIERNIIEWLKIGDSDIVHFGHLDLLLEGYLELHPMTYAERRALIAMLPLVHCEFALSETDYFLNILHSEEKAVLAYEGYFVAHAKWFRGIQGQQLLAHLARWAEGGAS